MQFLKNKVQDWWSLGIRHHLTALIPSAGLAKLLEETDYEGPFYGFVFFSVLIVIYAYFLDKVSKQKNWQKKNDPRVFFDELVRNFEGTSKEFEKKVEDEKEQLEIKYIDANTEDKITDSCYGQL